MSLFIEIKNLMSSCLCSQSVDEKAFSPGQKQTFAPCLAIISFVYLQTQNDAATGLQRVTRE